MWVRVIYHKGVAHSVVAKTIIKACSIFPVKLAYNIRVLDYKGTPTSQAAAFMLLHVPGNPNNSNPDGAYGPYLLHQ
jgi:hypothetical protein